ncbi:aspartate kinase [Desulfothermobacter acidiphilus]|uniref:aspartate kinase n=1 Tax=Desulfothermobacter acidiphilus TaxID=1938353 RepID=UPI003F8A0A15
MLLVQKFGGSSVADVSRIKRVAERVYSTCLEGHQVVVVVSAMGDTTDELIELAHQVNPSPSPREMDQLLSTGEQVSIALLSLALQALGGDAISLTGAQAGITTDGTYGKASITAVDTQRLRRELEQGRIPVVAGFQGKAPNGDVNTLGRGGSDTTAVALAAALRADICEIYTDVEGVFTADPRLEPAAVKLPCISYDEMLELACLGAVVLHPRAVELAKIHQVPLRVRSSFTTDLGTEIKEEEAMEQKRVVSGIAHDAQVAKIGLFDVFDRPGIAHTLFSALAAEKINVDMIIQGMTRDGRNDISFTISRHDLPQALKVVERVKESIGAKGYTYNDRVGKVSIVGAGMVTHSGVAAAMFAALSAEGINIEMISTSEIKISCIIKEEEIPRAVRALHRCFSLERLVDTK